MTAKQYTVLSAGILGVLASLCLGWSHYILNSPHLDQKDLIFAHQLTIGAIPFSLAGYWHVYQMLAPKQNPLAGFICLVGGYGFLMGHMVLAHNNLDLYDALLHFHRFTTLFFSLGFMMVVSFYPTYYPRWFILMNPMSILIIVFLGILTQPTIENFMAPLALIMANIIFLIISTGILIKGSYGLGGEKL